MNQADSPLPVKRIETPDHVIWIARPSDHTFIGSVPGTVATGDERGHRPQPGMLSILERLSVRIRARGKPGGSSDMMGGEWHEGTIPVKSRREC